MTYSIIETISILFIVLGVLLAISAVITFYTKNMAEVYDALLNRGYTERIEKRKRIKQAKRKKASAVNVNQAAMPQTVAPPQSPPKSAAPPVRAGLDVGAYANVQNNSGNTVLLNNNNSGQTTLLDSQTSGETTVLDNNIQSEFKIIKHLEYTFAKEVIS